MNDIMHFGILGMKWGRRRGRSGGVSDSPDHVRTRAFKKKKTSQLSTEELKELTTRLQLEKQYKDLSRAQVSRGQKIVTSILASVGKQIAKKYANDMGYSNIANVIDVIPTS